MRNTKDCCKSERISDFNLNKRNSWTDKISTMRENINENLEFQQRDIIRDSLKSLKKSVKINLLAKQT